MIRWILVSWAANAIALGVAGWLLHGVTFHHSYKTVVIAAAVFGVLNTVLKPPLKLLTLPLAIVTLGVAWFFVSILMLWITVGLVDKFAIDGFWSYVWMTVVVWAVNLVLDAALRPRKKRR
jgi:putative membrane protein